MMTIDELANKIGKKYGVRLIAHHIRDEQASTEYEGEFWSIDSNLYRATDNVIIALCNKLNILTGKVQIEVMKSGKDRFYQEIEFFFDYKNYNLLKYYHCKKTTYKSHNFSASFRLSESEKKPYIGIGVLSLERFKPTCNSFYLNFHIDDMNGEYCDVRISDGQQSIITTLKKYASCPVLKESLGILLVREAKMVYASCNKAKLYYNEDDRVLLADNNGVILYNVYPAKTDMIRELSVETRSFFTFLLDKKERGLLKAFAKEVNIYTKLNKDDSEVALFVKDIYGNSAVIVKEAIQMLFHTKHDEPDLIEVNKFCLCLVVKTDHLNIGVNTFEFNTVRQTTPVKLNDGFVLAIDCYDDSQVPFVVDKFLD